MHLTIPDTSVRHDRVHACSKFAHETMVWLMSVRPSQDLKSTNILIDSVSDFLCVIKPFAFELACKFSKPFDLPVLLGKQIVIQTDANVKNSWLPIFFSQLQMRLSQSVFGACITPNLYQMCAYFHIRHLAHTKCWCVTFLLDRHDCGVSHRKRPLIMLPPFACDSDCHLHTDGSGIGHDWLTIMTMRARICDVHSWIHHLQYCMRCFKGMAKLFSGTKLARDAQRFLGCLKKLPACAHALGPLCVVWHVHSIKYSGILCRASAHASPTSGCLQKLHAGWPLAHHFGWLR